LTTKEIGYILNIPEGTVRSRLSTARGQLKKILKLEG
ncbi:sigma factor-like helix-turn-helix DNA-binding protein, partial [Streptomyces sp. NPDC013087]